MKKLDHKWLGPYKINKVVSCNAYGLPLPLFFGQTHLVFSVVVLHPYEEGTISEHQVLLPPPSIIRDGICKGLHLYLRLTTCHKRTLTRCIINGALMMVQCGYK